MAKKKDKARAEELRKRAEEILAEKPEAFRALAPADIQKLIHELNVYQIELELQNEELRRTQLELQEARDKYLNLYDFAPTGYFILDHNSLIVDVNLAGSELLGSEKHRLIGTQFTSSISPDSQDAFYFHWREVLKTGAKSSCELKMLKADGTLFPAQLIRMAMPEKDGNINQFRTAVIDITERKQAEEALRQLEQKAQLVSRLASVGELASGVAHEINNPLTGVIGYAQLLMDREDVPSDIRSDLAAINDGAQRVAGIVKRLLTFSRQTKPERKLVDINELIESTLILRAYHFRVNDIEVVTLLATDVLETVADPGQIQQVLLNLIVNAETEMKLAHGKGKLIITTKKSDNTIKICFQDNGPGIKPEVMDKIFNPFFTTREVGEGTGLGLSICHGIVTEHRGRIWAESEPGKGATFIMELPVVTAAEQPKPSEPVVEEPEKVAKARILVVDYEQIIRDFVKRVLAGEGYEVETANNAAAALKKIESKRYSLILVAIKMPGMDGVELYKCIQKIARSLARRVVFITGDVMGADTEKFLSETKVAHIDKPFDAEQLSREVKRALIGGQ
ncbi:MAG: ATP-binding protein [Dehalococcoidia bacterium]|nr:ATP-binding protein [Dehalococcoidia bacterium]